MNYDRLAVVRHGCVAESVDFVIVVLFWKDKIEIKISWFSERHAHTEYILIEINLAVLFQYPVSISLSFRHLRHGRSHVKVIHW